MNKICFGCGAKLQSSDEKLTGYVPENKFNDSKYCQRCFKINHYGAVFENETPKAIKSLINAINADHKFVIFLADFLSINSKVIRTFKAIKQDKILVISKSDIIPKDVKEETVRSFLKKQYGINNDIKFVSVFNHKSISSFNNYLMRNHIKEAYLVGLSNAGKSNLVNKLMELSGASSKKVTTSNTPNTTLDFIRIKINEDLMLIDSPGFMIDGVLINTHAIKGSIKPKVYQLKAGESLKIGDIILNFSVATSAILYMANELKVNKYFKEAITDQEIEVNDNVDLVITGLGFINIKQSGKIRMMNINPENIEVRESIFGEAHE